MNGDCYEYGGEDVVGDEGGIKVGWLILNFFAWFCFLINGDCFLCFFNWNPTIHVWPTYLLWIDVKWAENIFQFDCRSKCRTKQ